MRAVLQRVQWARVHVDAETVGEIGPGLLIFLGVERGDGARELTTLAHKVAGLRIFADASGRMNRSVLDSSRQCLVVSQFTLHADCRKGRRPSFVRSEAPEQAARRYQEFIDKLAEQGLEVASGRFAADMQVELCNDGPVTILLDTAEL